MKTTFKCLAFVSLMFYLNLTYANQEEIQRCLASIPDDGKEENYLLFYVPSKGAISDTTFVAMSKRKGASAMSKNLAKIFYKGRKENQSYIVCGPSSKKSVQVLGDAFRYSLKKKRVFSNLTVSYIGRNIDFSQIENEADSLQVELVTFSLNEKDIQL